MGCPESVDGELCQGPHHVLTANLLTGFSRLFPDLYLSDALTRSA